MTDQFEFVIVGAGAAGCLLASRLARTAKTPTVLLLEAGGENSDPEYRIPANRVTLVSSQPELNHGYVTEAQKGLNGVQLPYARGKGLGGSSAINFMDYTKGPRDDYEMWAQLVGDNEWRWANVKERYKKLENYDTNVPEEYANIAAPLPENHGHGGPIDVCLSLYNMESQKIIIDAASELNLPKNLDLNSGNPIGIAIVPSTRTAKLRTTSASANLTDRPDNLTVWTGAKAVKILFDGKKADGVELADGRRVYATHDVILTAGSIDTPKLLLLSGVGDPSSLTPHGIPVHHILPVGDNLQDHVGTILRAHIGPGLNKRMPFDSAFQAAAREQWAKDQTGPFVGWDASQTQIYAKLESVIQSKEFQDLDPKLQEHMLKETVPIYEMTFGYPLRPTNHQFPKGDTYFCGAAILHNPQSKGTVRLRSSDPVDPPCLDTAYLVHPFDQRVAIEALRVAVWFLSESKVIKPFFRGWIDMPKFDIESDADMLALFKHQLTPVWHASGTTKMGKPEDKSACVDTDFRVRGLQSLRVVDLSVCPFVLNCHTQAIAYLIAQTAAEKITSEYGLNSESANGAN